MDYTTKALAACESKRWELRTKGYPQSMVAAAVERAFGTALKRVQPIDESIRSQAFYDILITELHQCEAWCKQLTVMLAQP